MKSWTISILVFLAAAAAPAAAQDLVGTAAVKDGDTLFVAGVEIRPAGWDAPEHRQTCFDAAGAEWPCGREATTVLRSLVEGRTVACRDTGGRSYGRRVMVCYVDGRDLGDVMVGGGWAVDVPAFSGGRYAAREAAARAARLGAWRGGKDGFQNPYFWRRENRRSRRKPE